MRVGKSLRFEQSDLTERPEIKSSTKALGPTRREVPESITPLYLEASTFLEPTEIESRSKAQYFSSTTLCF